MAIESRAITAGMSDIKVHYRWFFAMKGSEMPCFMKSFHCLLNEKTFLLDSKCIKKTKYNDNLVPTQRG